MRSYDYSHFEITLGTSAGEPLSDSQVDELRKQAQRLADKAVNQYKVAKIAAERKLNASYYTRSATETVNELGSIKEEDLTPEQRAELKAARDSLFLASRADYDYEDDWRDESEE